jgi:hypothetical protein
MRKRRSTPSKLKRPVENATEHPTAAEVKSPARNAQSLSAGVTVEAVAHVAANLVCAYMNNAGGASTRRVVGNLDDFTLDQIAKLAVRLIRACGTALLQLESQRADTTGKTSHRHYDFDEALELFFPKMSKSRREKSYADFLRYAARHDEAKELGKQIEAIPDPSADRIRMQIQEDKRFGFSEIVLANITKDIHEWRTTAISQLRRASGRRGALASVRQRQKKKYKVVP